ncbi:hypothetical protein BH11BAC4_BH11BAC4_21690 [soil metagenome]
MASNKKISANRLCKLFSTVLMFCCLFFLTAVNFIVFPRHEKEKAVSFNIQGKQDDDPSAPVEEKSTSNSIPTVQEEYLHEKHSFKEIERLENFHHHQPLAAEKLQFVHYELLSPPPKV